MVNYESVAGKVVRKVFTQLIFIHSVHTGTLSTLSAYPYTLILLYILFFHSKESIVCRKKMGSVGTMGTFANTGRSAHATPLQIGVNRKDTVFVVDITFFRVTRGHRNRPNLQLWRVMNRLFITPRAP